MIQSPQIRCALVVRKGICWLCFEITITKGLILKSSAKAVVLQLFHEASCLAPKDVTREEFLKRHHMRGEKVRAEFGKTKNWLGGVLTALEEADVPTEIGLCTACLPGGVVCQDDFEHLADELLDSLEQCLSSGPVTHLFLLLHGALLARGYDDPEGWLASKVRARIGDGVRVAISLDFHANVSELLVESADILLGGKLYPHTDAAERGRRLVELALSDRALKTYRYASGVISQMPRQETIDGPFRDLAQLTDKLQGGSVSDVSLLGGFPYSYASFRGMTCLVTAESRKQADDVAAEVVQAVSKVGEALQEPVPSVAEALPDIQNAMSNGLVVVADVGDNPGGGGSGDVTGLLSELVAMKCRFAFAFLVNEALVKKAVSAGVGGHIRVDTSEGGFEADVVSLPEIYYRNVGAMMHGEVLDGGQGAVLGVGSSRILLSSLRVQAYDVNAFGAFGIDLAKMEIAAVKSIAHFRACFTSIAKGGVILVDSFGLSSPRKAQL